MKRTMIVIIALLIGTPVFAQQPTRKAQQRAATVDALIRAACPDIVGISLGNGRDKTTWRIDFVPTAGSACKAAAQSAIDKFEVPQNF